MSSRTTTDGFEHDVCRGSGSLVLPEPEHDPTGRVKPRIRVFIASAIGLELGDPPIAVLFRHSSVGRAAVPEAAIDIDGHPRAGKHDIRTSAGTVDRPVDEVPEAEAV
jgi:hypothetical protein